MASPAEAERAFVAHRDRMMAHPNVRTMSVMDEERGSVIEIGLEREESESASASRVPDELEIPDSSGRLTGSGPMVAVRKRVVGAIYAQSFTNRVRPANGGNSCGPSAARWFGTLGARVDRKGTACILSNWHVLYGGVGQDGSTIVQPARGDNGQAPEDTIAHNLAGVLDDYVDAAIAQVDKPVDDNVSAGTRCYGPIKGVRAAEKEMSVRKCGRTTESTEGTVRATNVSVRIDGYPNGSRLFHGQIEMTKMSVPGDSGAILVDDDSKAVGLVFASGDYSSYANDIQRVLDAFGITFA